MLRRESQPHDGPMAPLTVPVPGQRLRWLCSQLDAYGIPYQVRVDQAGQYVVDTHLVAQPLVDQVLGYAPRRQPQRPPWLRGIGRLVLLLAMLLATAAVLGPFGLDGAAGLAALVSVNPSVMRAGGVLLLGSIGIVAIVAWIGKPPAGMPDGRGGLLFGLFCLLLAAAGAIALVGLGVL